MYRPVRLHTLKPGTMFRFGRRPSEGDLWKYLGKKDVVEPDVYMMPCGHVIEHVPTGRRERQQYIFSRPPLVTVVDD